MKSYYRIMLGRESAHAAECFAGGFIGTDFGIDEDLSGRLPDVWREFNSRFIPVYLSKHPDKTKISAGLACGALWTVSKGVRKGDIVLCPDGTGTYRAGKVASDYYYAKGEVLPSDVVVGQILRYMGFVKEQVAEENQTVEGAIIALEDDQKMRWALAAVPSISFFRYQMSFKLVKA